VGVNKVHIVQLLKKKRERLIQVYIITVCVFASSILFLFPQRTHYFWRVSRFLFMERKQDYNVTSVKNVKVCFQRRKYQKQWTYLLNHTFCNAKNLLHLQSSWKKIQKGYIKLNYRMSPASQTPALPVMGSLIVLVNKRADWNVPVSYIKCMSLCSALWFQHLKKHQK
jgi:Na+-translocating ferredoxin:NAD+ oxidoreductase RnfD subunit